MKIKNILIIEDDADQLEVLSWNLTNSGYNIISSIDSIEGISNFIKQKADLILLDLNLPFLSGETVIESLERNKILKKTPIIIISGESNVRIDNAIKKIKPLKTFKKPFLLNSLIKYIDELNK